MDVLNTFPTFDKLEKTEKQLVLATPEVPVNITLWTQAAYECVQGNIVTANDLAEFLQCTFEQALTVMMSAQFSTFVHNMTIAISKHQFDTIALPKLMHIAKVGLHKDSINAIKELSNILGYTNKDGATQQSQVHIHLENLISNLKKEKDSVIDIEPYF